PEPDDFLPRIPEPYDSGWKRVLFRFFFEVIDFFFPALGILIDRNVAPVFLDTELKQISPGGRIGHRRSDALVKVQLVSGSQQILFCHLELQTKEDQTIAERSFVYAFRIYEKFGTFPITLLLLADTNASFRPSTFELAPTKLAGVSFRFLSAKTMDFVPALDDLGVSDKVIAQVLWVYLTHQQEKTRIRKVRVSRVQEWFLVKTRIMRHLVSLNIDDKLISEVLWFLDWIIHLPQAYEKSYTTIQIGEQRKKEGTVAFVSSYERVFKKEGKIEALQETIISILDKKYGLSTEERELVTTCDNLQTLKDVQDAAVFGTSKDEALDHFSDEIED
ncbi:MAG: hypothetical protein GW949_10820, partial [Spirochaetales bacterium]|nr:hypothetical protein [Spirochaetales bacterium]